MVNKEKYPILEFDVNKEAKLSEGCLTVEMESSALLAVSQFRNVELGQLIYGGDDLSNVIWDGRRCVDRTQIREELVNLSLRICTKL